MKKIGLFLQLLFIGVLSTLHMQAQQNRYIVRVSGGLPVVQAACGLLNCSVVTGLDGALGQVFLVTPPANADGGGFLTALAGQTGVVDAEPDQQARTAGRRSTVPSALTDRTPVQFYGATVINGYVHQPATSLVSLDAARTQTQSAGTGTVAVIDTGVDPNHPVLKDVLLPGYDFTRDAPGGDETLDVALPALPQPGVQPIWTNDRSSALVDQSTAAVIDGNAQYGDFGHGTMVAGVVHLTAPTAKILPLKAFKSDGTGYNSDIIRAIYYAIGQHVSVLNMSFNLAGYSQEVKTAIDTASQANVVSVASSGNAGNDTPLYPASYPAVMSVASTSNTDQLSTFSSYGKSVWVGAPGEGVVTTYPWGTYAAAWGTSFSAPFISGTVALMRGTQPVFNQSMGAQAVGHADAVEAQVGNGRLNILKVMQLWSNPLATAAWF